MRHDEIACYLFCKYRTDWITNSSRTIIRLYAFTCQINIIVFGGDPFSARRISCCPIIIIPQNYGVSILCCGAINGNTVLCFSRKFTSTQQLLPFYLCRYPPFHAPRIVKVHASIIIKIILWPEVIRRHRPVIIAGPLHAQAQVHGIGSLIADVRRYRSIEIRRFGGHRDGVHVKIQRNDVIVCLVHRPTVRKDLPTDTELLRSRKASSKT